MKAIALFSGGLDSTLAIKMIVEQGIEVMALHINTGFGATKSKRDHMEYICSQIGAELRVVNVQDDYIKEVLFTAENGYGKYFNPCIDCHSFMFSVAKKIMNEVGASFLISGEVIGQRPMSQNPTALKKVLKISDCDGLLLRPMCAKILEPTIAEEKGWVDRDKLLDIHGRDRKKQIALAKEYGIKDYATPAGGCLLTDTGFSNKMKDFVKYSDDFNSDDITIMKFGRHLRLPDGAKLVIGRNSEENDILNSSKNDRYYKINLEGLTGPLSLLSKNANSSDKYLALKSVLAYTKAEDDVEYNLNVDGKVFSATKLDKEITNKFSVSNIATS